MHQFLLLLSFVLATPAFGQSVWETVDLGTTEDLRAINRGTQIWVVGTNGFVAGASSDYETWTTFDIGTNQDLVSVIRTSPNGVTDYFYIGGEEGTVRYTIGNGANWQSNDVPDATQAYVIRSKGFGFLALGSEGSLYTTPNNSAPWEARESGTTNALNDSFLRGIHIAVGDGGTILRSEIAGETWTQVESGTTADLHAVAGFVGDGWIAIGEGGTVLKSTDNGLTWTPRESGTTATLYGLYEFGFGFLAVGEGGALLQTENRGETWCTIDTGTTNTLYSIGRVGLSFRRRWFLAGEGGLLLKSQSASVGDCGAVASEPGASEGGYTLSVVWPNPMTERAVFSLSVDRPQRVTVELVDGLGRRVQMLHDGLAEAGDPLTLHIEAGDLAPGLYIVHVQGETFSATRPVTVTR